MPDYIIGQRCLPPIKRKAGELRKHVPAMITHVPSLVANVPYMVAHGSTVIIHGGSQLAPRATVDPGAASMSGRCSDAVDSGTVHIDIGSQGAPQTPGGGSKRYSRGRRLPTQEYVGPAC